MHYDDASVIAQPAELTAQPVSVTEISAVDLNHTFVRGMKVDHHFDLITCTLCTQAGLTAAQDPTTVRPLAGCELNSSFQAPHTLVHSMWPSPLDYWYCGRTIGINSLYNYGQYQLYQFPALVEGGFF